MRYFTFILFFIFINTANADEWNSRINQLIDVYKKSVSNPKPIVYPELGNRVKNVFLLNDRNLIEVSILENGKLFSKTDLYYSEGKLYVIQHKEGWNLVTKNDSIYEWKDGEDAGIRIKKKDSDIVDYILYLTDPALFMTGLFHGYKTEPEKYNIESIDDEQLKWFVLKEPLYGFKSVAVDEDTFWFHGFRMENPESKIEYTYRFSKPRKYQTLPKSLLDDMEKIKFTDSAKTLRRHMSYL